MDVALDEDTLRGVRIEASGRYGADLTAAATRARALTTAVVSDVVGRAEDPLVPIDVVVTDVHR